MAIVGNCFKINTTPFWNPGTSLTGPSSPCPDLAEVDRTEVGREDRLAGLGSRLVVAEDRPCLEEDQEAGASDRTAPGRVVQHCEDRLVVHAPRLLCAALPPPSSLPSIPCGSL